MGTGQVLAVFKCWSFVGMDKNGFIAVIFVFAFVSSTCNASLVFHHRKLITSEANNGSISPQVSPAGSPVNESNANPINAGKSKEEKQKESEKDNQNNSNNRTVPIDPKESKKNENDSKPSEAPSPPATENNGTTVDSGAGKAASTSTPKLGNNGSCEGSLTSCRVQEMLACIEASKQGSKELILVVKNEGKSTLKVTVSSPNYMKNDLPALEVPKHKTRRMNIWSIAGKGTDLTVNSGNANCVLHLVNPVSVDNLMRQISFYSKQVSPIYAVYGSVLLALLLGGTWACCKLRKRDQQDGVPYQELEMGLPESASADNADAAEGWDHDWDDDWDEDVAVKSPGGQQVRSISADGLTSRPNKKDGWDNDWQD